MTAAYITARRPVEVAAEVDRLRRDGCRAFVLVLLDGGGMLDLERLGAGRYAAGLQAEVELEGHSSPAPAGSPAAGVGAR